MPQLHVISARPVTVSVTGKVRPRKRNAADPLQQAIDKTPAGPLLDALDFGKKKRKKTAAKKRRKAKAKRTRRRNPWGFKGFRLGVSGRYSDASDAWNAQSGTPKTYTRTGKVSGRGVKAKEYFFEGFSRGVAIRSAREAARDKLKAKNRKSAKKTTKRKPVKAKSNRHKAKRKR